MHCTCASPLIAAQSRGMAAAGATVVASVDDEEFVAPLSDPLGATCALTAAQADIDTAATSAFNCHCLMLPPHVDEARECAP